MSVSTGRKQAYSASLTRKRAAHRRRACATVLWHAPLIDRFTGQRGSGSVGGLRSVDHPEGLQLEAGGQHVEQLTATADATRT